MDPETKWKEGDVTLVNSIIGLVLVKLVRRIVVPSGGYRLVDKRGWGENRWVVRVMASSSELGPESVSEQEISEDWLHGEPPKDGRGAS